MPEIKNLVFDLGGVLYAIDPPRAAVALTRLSPQPVDAYSWYRSRMPLFDRLETGHVSPGEFRDTLRMEGGLQASDAEIDAAWNALLIGVMHDRIPDLMALKQHYRLVMLSNTNIIHQNHLKEACQTLFSAFERVFFSYDMGLRKPDPAIFIQALNEMGMPPHESLFIDDNQSNVDGSIQAGMQGYFLTAHDDLAWRELRSKLFAAKVV